MTLDTPHVSNGNKIACTSVIEERNGVASSENLRRAVKLPKGENKCEWIASHIYDFYTQISMLYDTIEEYCSCPYMSYGPERHYEWFDHKYYSAPEHIFRMFTWIQRLLDNHKLFPTKIDQHFPKEDGFLLISRLIFRRMFEFFAHIYRYHLDDVRKLKQETHLDTSFKHFLFFTHGNGLLRESDMEPLQEEYQRAFQQ
ncbi:MOB kinase activator 1A, partial [Fragariocoptes setiger]